MRALYHHRTQGRDVEAVHIRGICAGLGELGWQVEVVAPPGVSTDPDAGTVARSDQATGGWSRLAARLPQALFESMEIGYNLVAVPRLWLRCRALRPALIYERYALYNAAGVLVGRLTGTPVILEVNDTAHVDRTRQGKTPVAPRLAAWAERQIFRSAHGVAAVSGYLRDQVIAAGVPAERVRVTPNAVDPERFNPERVGGTAIRERHGLGDAPIVGFVGSFARWHGVELLIEAFAALGDEFPQARLLLVGDGARRDAAKALAERLGAGQRVVFAGRVPHAAVPEHLAAMDVGVMPASNVFGSPVKVFEYQAMGIPAVAPRLGPLEEAIEPDVTGLLFPPGDRAALRACLVALLTDAPARREMGRAGRERVLARHLWIHNAAAVVALAAARPRAAHPGIDTGCTELETAAEGGA